MVLGCKFRSQWLGFLRDLVPSHPTTLPYKSLLKTLSLTSAFAESSLPLPHLLGTHIKCHLLHKAFPDCFSPKTRSRVPCWALDGLVFITAPIVSSSKGLLLACHSSSCGKELSSSPSHPGHRGADSSPGTGPTPPLAGAPQLSLCAPSL